jgi:hypothetical protein
MPTVLPLLCCLLAAAPEAGRPFAIEVVDEQTGRGVSLIELRTVNNIRLVTDSNGIAAFDEPGLMDQRVFFDVTGHGYEFPKDGFGIRGKALDVRPGGSARLTVKRINIAERLYRVTGAGIYRDSVLVGRAVPIRHPLLNAQVLGSDSVLSAVYRGKIRWFWGDTNRPSYPLGNFHVPGATSPLPADDGLDPGRGVDLDYFVDEHGFARPTAQVPGPGPTWLGGLVVLRDRPSGRERMFASYAKIRPPMDVYERGLVEYDDATDRFRKVATFPPDAPTRPDGHPFLRTEGGVEYAYFATPYPLTRVRADAEDLAHPGRYETFSCLVPGSRLDRPRIDRDAAGRPRYGWKRDTPAVGPAEQARLIKDGLLRPEEALLHLRDAETGTPVTAHGGSVYWNDHRGRWVMIAVEVMGTSFLGEVWFAEADTPLGPWVYARKVVTHERYSFYNPKQHPFFDEDGGRVIYFEGTYTHTFSGNTEPTARYDYNQVMYRLDLADGRLNLPVPVYRRPGAATFATARRPGPGPEGLPVAFFALERPGPGTVPVFAAQAEGGTPVLRVGSPPEGITPLFYALPADTKDPPATTVPLYESTDSEGTRTYTTEEPPSRPDGRRPGQPIGRVWRNPLRVPLP